MCYRPSDTKQLLFELPPTHSDGLGDIFVRGGSGEYDYLRSLCFSMLDMSYILSTPVLGSVNSRYHQAAWHKQRMW